MGWHAEEQIGVMVPGEAKPAATGDAGVSSAPADADAKSFAALGLSEALLRSIHDVGYEEPTPIQIETIPVLLAGRDAIAQAQTGSGKTAAFGLPIIEAIDPRERRVQALILCPPRELAIQVAEALHKYGRHKEVETLPIYGGQPYERQLRGVQIVVGTPGRVMDHMRRGTLALDHVRFFVLDEADEMLDMGFIEDIEWILEQAPAERQTALFSATMPPRIAVLAQRYLRQPVRITVAGKQMTVPETRQSFYEVPRPRKVDALTRILDAETPTSAMIFCRTKVGVDELGEALMARGYAVETLHGDLSQVQRDRVMRRFRAGQADVLIATDVAARGLDIPEVSHVINFDVPESAEAYVHRIGRTGRAGRAGAAITLVTPREVRWMRQIERITRARIEARRLPTLADVAVRRREAMAQQVRAVLANEEGYEPYLDTVAELAEERDAVEVAAAILKLYADETGRGTTPEQQEDDVATLAAAGAGRSESGMVRLFLNVGRNQGIRPQDVVGAIANEAAIPGRAIGAIDILDAYTFVDIPREYVDQVLEAMRTAAIKGRRVNAQIARPDGWAAPDREGRDGRPREVRGAYAPRREYAGGGRVRRDRDDAHSRAETGGGRRFDRTGPARFRVRREGTPPRPTRRDE
jgi:ATP-dependent RNA helicase DeaD